MNASIASLSRRNLIAGACASGMLAACSRTSPPEEPEADLSVSAAAAGRALAHGAMQDWAGMVGTVFRTGGGGTLRVAGVQPLQSGGDRPADLARAAAFLVVFDAIGAVPGNLIHRIEAPGYGPLDVFVADAASAEFPARMHAVFN